MVRGIRTLGLGVALAAALGSSAWAQAASSVSPFVNVRVGMNLYDTTLTTTTPTGAPFKAVDQGGDAMRVDLGGGVDWRSARGFVLGAEASLGATSGRSRLMAAGVDYSWRAPVVSEIALRAGWRSAAGAGIILRVGTTVAQVRTDLNGRDSSSWEAGLLVGVSAEVPIGTASPAFVRIDVSRSEVTGVEMWAGTVGIGYRW